MLQASHPFRIGTGPAVPLAAPPALGALLGVLSRQWRLICAVLALCVIAGVAYVVAAPRFFTASTSLMLDIRQEDPLQKRQALDAQSEGTLIESQVRMLSSDAIVLAVVRNLGLQNDPEFTQDDRLLPIRLLSAAVAALSGNGRPPTAQEIERAVADRVIDRMRAVRDGRTYVIALSFTARDPDKAARIANALAETYTQDQLSARLGAADRSVGWLGARLEQLQQQARAADKAVEDFKERNRIVGTNDGFVHEQQIAELSSQLSQARAQSAERKARLDRVRSLGPDGMPEAIVSEALQNSVIVRLRQQYLEAARRESELGDRYGASHPVVLNLRAEMTQLRAAVRDELSRIAATYDSDFQIARSREEELERSLSTLVDRASRTNQQRVELRSLEANAHTYRSLFETFLQQYATTLQQESFPIAYARVITPATPPSRKSSPRTILVLIAAVAGGLGFGWMLSLMRESLDRTAKSADQIESLTGLPAIGVLPEIPRRRPALLRSARAPGARPVVGHANALFQISRLFPFSHFANTIQNVRVALDLAGAARPLAVVGIVSCRRGEGRTLLAANLGHHLAKSGARTLLLDCDFGTATLTRSTAAAQDAGLVDVVRGLRRTDEAIMHDADSGLAFLPQGRSPGVPSSVEFLTSHEFRAFLDKARQVFDYVVLDLPPLSSTVEAQALASVADGVVLVCAADRTEIADLQRAVQRWDALPIVGFVLNRVRKGASARRAPAQPAPVRPQLTTSA